MTGKQTNTIGTGILIPVLASSGFTIVALFCGYWGIRQHEKYLRSRWVEEGKQKEELACDEDDDGESAAPVGQEMPSVIKHFKSLELSSQSTVLEANRRRTTSYYEKMREGVRESLVLGIPNYQHLLKKRQAEIKRLVFYHKQGKKSLRTVIIMMDIETQNILNEARQKILQPLHYSYDKYTKDVWIPEINIIPRQDMHVSVACPWWWHTMRDGNYELSQDLSKRLRQTLVVDFHHPFFIELERIILLGGKILVALWRTVGERTTIDGNITILDRHGSTIDPMVRLRREIVECFTNEENEYNFIPLTHTHRKNTVNNLNNIKEGCDDNNETPAPAQPPPQKMERQHTIEMKTPGLGSGDGFIHTTLCRLPLDCFSMADVELEPIHRLCREATATYAGHRMLVRKFRFLETTGEGGDSNPCKNPIFDETIKAPPKVSPAIKMRTLAAVGRNNNMDGPSRNAEMNAHTTGRSSSVGILPGVEGLFQPHHI